jgi:hypothetical protein
VETPDGEFDHTCDYQLVSARPGDPLSHDVAHCYWAIVANGSPAPHESADWRNTMHGLRLRAEQAVRERDEARAEVERLKTDVRILEKSNDAKLEQWRSAERDLACAKEALAEMRAKFEAP